MNRKGEGHKNDQQGGQDKNRNRKEEVQERIGTGIGRKKDQYMGTGLELETCRKLGRTIRGRVTWTETRLKKGKGLGQGIKLGQGT